MQVTVRYFAAHKEAVGVAKETVELPPGTTVKELVDELMLRHPGLEALCRDTVVSLNKGLGPEDIQLRDGDDVALFPPISGG